LVWGAPGSGAAISLTIRDDNGICTGLDSDAGILGIHDALENQGTPPLALDPLYIRPRQSRVELLLKRQKKKHHDGESNVMPRMMRDCVDLKPIMLANQGAAKECETTFHAGMPNQKQVAKRNLAAVRPRQRAPKRGSDLKGRFGG
jgi:hypothetical protein